VTPDDGERRSSGLSRRRLLAGIGGVGAVGMASGLGTGAYLSDRVTFANNGFGAGTVELTVGDGVADGVVVDVSGVDRGPEGRVTETFPVGVRTNPARVWLAAECPDDAALAAALRIDLRVDGRSITDGLRPFAAVAADLVSGERIDDGCLGPDDALAVEVTAELPADAPDALAGTATSLRLRLYAEQCRHVTETAATGANPFAGRACEGPACVSCEDENGVAIGSLTLRYRGDEAARVTVAATGGGAGGVGTGGTVVFAGDVAPNETFVVDGSDAPTNGDPGWLGPNIYVDADSDAADGSDAGSDDSGPGRGNGGPERPAGVKIHTSCPEPLAVGMRFGENGEFEIAAGTTTAGEPLCGSEEN